MMGCGEKVVGVEVGIVVKVNDSFWMVFGGELWVWVSWMFVDILLEWLEFVLDENVVMILVVGVILSVLDVLVVLVNLMIFDLV